LNDSWKCKINDKLDYRLNLLNFVDNTYIYQSW
jgi:outer membrane receptor for monomeric catechols